VASPEPALGGLSRSAGGPAPAALRQTSSRYLIRKRILPFPRCGRGPSALRQKTTSRW